MKQKYDTTITYWLRKHGETYYLDSEPVLCLSACIWYLALAPEWIKLELSSSPKGVGWNQAKQALGGAVIETKERPWTSTLGLMHAVCLLPQTFWFRISKWT